MNQLRQRALDVAMEGRSEAEAKAQLIHDFPGDDVTGEQINAAVYYAYHGGDTGTANDPIAEAKAVAAYNKRKARKAMIMLKVNYKSAEHEAVTDCIADILHHCHAKGIDYSEAERIGRNHFNAELVGGEHG